MLYSKALDWRFHSHLVYTSLVYFIYITCPWRIGSAICWTIISIYLWVALAMMTTDPSNYSNHFGQNMKLPMVTTGYFPSTVMNWTNVFHITFIWTKELAKEKQQYWFSTCKPSGGLIPRPNLRSFSMMVLGELRLTSRTTWPKPSVTISLGHHFCPAFSTLLCQRNGIPKKFLLCMTSWLENLRRNQQTLPPKGSTNGIPFASASRGTHQLSRKLAISQDHLWPLSYLEKWICGLVLWFCSVFNQSPNHWMTLYGPQNPLFYENKNAFAIVGLRNLSEQKGKGICPECLAGLDDCPYEDVSTAPGWQVTKGLEKPWKQQDPSPFLAIPHRHGVPELLFRKDCFHIYKQTIGGHWVASSVVLLADLGYWSRPGESQQADKLLEFAHEDFAYFIKHEFAGNQVPHIKAFTKNVFHWLRIQTFPFGRFKGADCMMMVRWLYRCVLKGCWDPGTGQRPQVSLTTHPLDASDSRLLELILEGCRASLLFWRVLHNEGTWHCRNAAALVVDGAQKFCECYSKLASLCHARQLRRYHLEPSLHYMHHFAIDYQERLQLGDKHLLSPNNDNCETDEDFVGRLSRLSRSVHALSIPQRTIQRYLIKAYFVFTGQDWNSSGIKRRGRKRKLRLRQWKRYLPGNARHESPEPHRATGTGILVPTTSVTNFYHLLSVSNMNIPGHDIKYSTTPIISHVSAMSQHTMSFFCWNNPKKFRKY